jgi:hypothetical protein
MEQIVNRVTVKSQKSVEGLGQIGTAIKGDMDRALNGFGIGATRYKQTQQLNDLI